MLRPHIVTPSEHTCIKHSYIQTNLAHLYMIEQKIHQVTNTDTHTYTPSSKKQMHTETHTNPLTHTYSSQEYSPQNGIAVTAGTIFKSKASMTQSGATVWTKLIPAGNLVSAHQ